MTAIGDSGVRDARPPALVVRLTNVIMRPLLRTPLGRIVKPLALVEFTGRRTGTRRRVVVGWHGEASTALVVTPAPWRANFDGGYPAAVYWRGHRSAFTGTLETDPASVAAKVTAMLHNGTSARSLALKIPAGHALAPADITRTKRAIIHFERTDAAPRDTGRLRDVSVSDQRVSSTDRR